MLVGWEGYQFDVRVGLEFCCEGLEAAEDWRVGSDDAVVGHDADSEFSVVVWAGAEEAVGGGVFPGDGGEAGVVEPGLLVEEGYHEEFDAFEALT